MNTREPRTSVAASPPSATVSRPPTDPLWLTYTLAVVLIAASSWWFSFPGDGSIPGDGLFELAHIVVLPLLLLGWVAFILWWLGACWRGAAEWRRARVTRGKRHLIAGSLGLAAGVAIVIYSVTLQVRLFLSDSQLLDIARAATSEYRGTDRRAGLFTVQWSQVVGSGVVAIGTHDCGFDSRCGFVYAPQDDPGQVCGRSDVERYAHLYGPWYEFAWYGSDAGCY